MRRTRQVLAVMVVTTALCADRAAAAAPVVVGSTSAKPTLAGRLVNRLSRTFRQVVPSAAPVQARQVTVAPTAMAPLLADQSLGVQSPPISPFQFRLPPPTA
jgi:hypothetical protein